MSNARKAERRKEIEDVRQNARDAVDAGKSIHTCPYRFCDKMQWEDEFRRYSDALEEQKAADEEQRLLSSLRQAGTLEELKEWIAEYIVNKEL